MITEPCSVLNDRLTMHLDVSLSQEDIMIFLEWILHNLKIGKFISLMSFRDNGASSIVKLLGVALI